MNLLIIAFVDGIISKGQQELGMYRTEFISASLVIELTVAARPQQQKALVQSKDQHRLLVVFEIRLDNGEVYTVDNIMRETHGDGAVLCRCDFETSCYHRLPPVWP